MISDNLAGLFAANPKGAALTATFRMGVLLAFDPNDGSNTVQIGTSELTDLPLLINGAETGLQVGDIVSIRYLGNSCMIEGKIATVGGPNYGAGNNGRAGIVLNATNFVVLNAGSIVVTDSSVVVPGWANSVLVNMNGATTVKNSSATADGLASRITLVSGAGNTFSANIIESSALGNTAMSAHAGANYFAPVIPGETLTVEYFIQCGATGGHAANAANIATVFADFEFFREGLL